MAPHILGQTRICDDKTCCQRQGKPIASPSLQIGSEVTSRLAEDELKASEGRHRSCPSKVLLYLISDYPLATIACPGIVQVASVTEARKAAKGYGRRALYMVLRFYDEDGELHVEKRSGEFTKGKGGIAIRQERSQDGVNDSLHMTEAEVAHLIVRAAKGQIAICQYSSVVH